MTDQPAEITIRVKPDLSALKAAESDEIALLISRLYYGDGGPLDGGNALSFCADLARELCQRFWMVPRSSEPTTTGAEK